MTDFLIQYDSQRQKCTFRKNGKVLEPNTTIALKSWKKLREILELERYSGWKGLPEEIARECDDHEVKVSFKGEKEDVEALQHAFDTYKGDVVFQLDFETITNDIKKTEKNGMYYSFWSAIRRPLNNAGDTDVKTLEKKKSNAEGDEYVGNGLDNKERDMKIEDTIRNYMITRITIEYDSTFACSKFTKDNKVLDGDTKIGARSGERLQDILMENASGWKGLPREIASICNTYNVDLFFRGDSRDYNDLAEAFKLYKEDVVKYHLHYEGPCYNSSEAFDALVEKALMQKKQYNNSINDNDKGLQSGNENLGDEEINNEPNDDVDDMWYY